MPTLMSHAVPSKLLADSRVPRNCWYCGYPHKVEVANATQLLFCDQNCLDNYKIELDFKYA